jgi:peptidoglycan/xylan/chitin deacetylase (PgdA/CDA1 family)
MDALLQPSLTRGLDHLMDNELYEYSPIVSRPPLVLPNGARLAFYIGLNIEHFRVDLPFKGGVGTVPDPLSYGWRDYGNRVGIWRLMEIFDEFGIRATGIINSEVCTHYPAIIEAGSQRNWAWAAHGQTNSILPAGMDSDEEQACIDQMLTDFDSVLPSRPKGWLGPSLNETFQTPQLLADAGFTYLLDWCADDQPFSLNVSGLLSVPYSLDVNDWFYVDNPGITGQHYERIVLDQFEQLWEESSESGRVFALPLHPFLSGQPYRARALKRVLKEITSTEDVWVCTSDEIASHFAGQI